MTTRLTCTSCGTSYFGYDWNTIECNICRSSREANERSEKEMAQRERLSRRDQPYRPISPSDVSLQPGDGGFFISMILGMIGFTWLAHVLLGLDFNIMLTFLTCPIGGIIGAGIRHSFNS